MKKKSWPYIKHCKRWEWFKRKGVSADKSDKKVLDKQSRNDHWDKMLFYNLRKGKGFKNNHLNPEMPMKGLLIAI